MDEIEKRLREATDACIASYDAWRQNQKEGGTREALMEAMHELRKIAARLEIEIAVSERDEMTSRPIPIPPHRSSRPQTPGRDNFANDNIGNAVDNSGGNSNAGFSQGPRDNNRGGAGAGAGGQHRRRRMSVGGGHSGGGAPGGNNNGPRGGEQS